MMIRFAVVLLIAATLGGCTKKEVSHIGEPPTPVPLVRGAPWIIPPGVSVPKSKIGAAEIDGLYPSTIAADRMCCWIGKSARIEAIKPGAATTLDLTVFVPDYAPYRAKPQTLSVSINGARPDLRTLELGVNTLNFPLPATGSPNHGAMTLQLTPGYTFVPKAAGLNADTRELGIVLTRVDFH